MYVKAHEVYFEGFKRGFIVLNREDCSRCRFAAGERNYYCRATNQTAKSIWRAWPWTLLIYDVLGGTVGLRKVFAVPLLEEGIAEHVFTVSSSDFMALYAANKPFKGIQKYSNFRRSFIGRCHSQFSKCAWYAREIIDDFVKTDQLRSKSSIFPDPVTVNSERTARKNYDRSLSRFTAGKYILLLPSKN